MDKISLQSSLTNIYENTIKPTVERASDIGSVKKVNHKNLEALITYERSKSANSSKVDNDSLKSKNIKLIQKPQVYDILDISELSKKILNEIDKLKEVKMGDTPTIKELMAMYPEITDEYVISLLEFGESVMKPDDTLDDLQWATLMQLGSEIGMTDPNGLLQLTDLDLEIYFDLKYNKSDKFFDKLGDKDQFGNKVKRYENPADIWKEIFQTDIFGEFKRGNGGSLIRNENFTFTSSTVDSQLVDKSRSLIKGQDPAMLFQYAIAVNSGDRNIMNYARGLTAFRSVSDWYTNYDYAGMEKGGASTSL